MQSENLEKIRNIVRAVLEMGDDEPVDSVRQIAFRRWDSLAQVTMIAAVEAEFGIGIATSEYERFTSFDAIKILLEEKGL